MEAYSETTQAQNHLLEKRFRKALDYLSQLADEAEKARIEKWNVPVGLSPAEYTDLIRPFRKQIEEMIS